MLPLTGAIADRTQHKRRMLGLFAFTGATATALLALVTGTNWQLGVVLFIVATTGYYASVVIYYSVLPEIATADERDRLSSRGWAFGFLGGGIALAVNLATYFGRDALGLSRSYPLPLGFLAAYLIYADGIGTVASVAGQYGDLELGLASSTLISTILMVQFVAFFGALLHGWVARRIVAKRTILGSLVVWIGGVIGAATGSFRPAILSLVAFFRIGFVLVLIVPVRRAIHAAGNSEPAVI